jgi:aspartate kinase
MRRSHIGNNRLALVCSARSAATKEEGTTNRFDYDLRSAHRRLLRAAEEALVPGSNAHVEIVQAIREDHIGAARALIRDMEILGRVEREIDFECNRLENFLNAAQVSEVPKNPSDC